MAGKRVSDDIIRSRNKEIAAVCMSIIKRKMDANLRVYMSDVAREASKHSSSRFWVSDERAISVILAWVNHDEKHIDYPYWADPETMNHQHRLMYNEIYARCKIIRSRLPSQSIRSIILRVIYSPAPSFYVAPESILVYFYIGRKKSRQREKSK